MTQRRFLLIPVFIAILAGIIQIIDQLLHAYLEPVGNVGFGWISFQSWAMYFLAGCNLKGGLKSFLGYLVGISASICIMILSDSFSSLKFFNYPLSIFIVVIPVIFLEKVKLLNFIPAVFVGAGVFFAFMSYVPEATFVNAAITELVYCLLGLFFGFVTIIVRNAYERKFNKG